jgi:thioesterase domain-containing protein
MASACIKLMRARQPYGPYFLLGNCFGGFVTYEMAQQLSRDGERVQLLVMLDCYNHEWRRDLPFMSLCTHKARHALVRTRFHWTNLRLMSAKQRVCYFKERFAKFRHETRVRELQRLYDLSVRRRKPAPRIVSDIAYSNRWAEQVYQRRPYSGRILLISTTDPAGGIYPAPLMGWQKLFQGPVDAFDVAGDHLRMLFEPAVDKVSDLIKNATDPT